MFENTEFKPSTHLSIYLQLHTGGVHVFIKI